MILSRRSMIAIIARVRYRYGDLFAALSLALRGLDQAGLLISGSLIDIILLGRISLGLPHEFLGLCVDPGGLDEPGGYEPKGAVFAGLTPGPGRVPGSQLGHDRRVRSIGWIFMDHIGSMSTTIPWATVEFSLDSMIALPALSIKSLDPPIGRPIPPEFTTRASPYPLTHPHHPSYREPG